MKGCPSKAAQLCPSEECDRLWKRRSRVRRSVFRDYRAAPIDLVIDACPDNMLARMDVAGPGIGRSLHQRRRIAERPEIEIEILGLYRPLGVEGILGTRANCPSQARRRTRTQILRAAGENLIERRFDAANREAAG